MTEAKRNLGSTLILASSSPRRDQLLSEAGVRFEVLVPSGPEAERKCGEDCATFARRAAEEKARQVALVSPGRLVLGADTIVVLDDEVLGKPRGPEDALRMLRRLAGRAHQVITGVAFARAGSGGEVDLVGAAICSEVVFRHLSDQEIEGYVATGEPLDKAGAYGIQGLGGALVESYTGSHTNIVGLPMEYVLETLGRDLPDHRTAQDATLAGRRQN
ncbi:Maf family protein [bacterium]|nr:Maf family protein [bacterium]